MIVPKNKFTNCTFNINQIPVESVSKFSYFGTIVNEQWDYSQEIKSRVGKGRVVYSRINSLFKSHDLTMNTKMRLLRSYSQSSSTV